jgi:hypothetical protein
MKKLLMLVVCCVCLNCSSPGVSHMDNISTKDIYSIDDGKFFIRRLNIETVTIYMICDSLGNPIKNSVTSKSKYSIATVYP